MNTRSSVAAVIASFCAASVALDAQAATYNYSDTTFLGGDWTGLKFVDTTPGAAAIFSAGQSSPGGSPILPGPNTPDYRAIRHIFDNGTLIGSHQGNTLNWVPLPTETASLISYNYDLKYFDGPIGTVAFKPAIFQGGNVYVPAINDLISGPYIAGGPSPFGWQRFGAVSLPVVSFSQLDPATGGLLAGTPNLASAMSFGFISGNSSGPGGPFTKLSGLDNYSVTLVTTIVPEPTTLVALAAATTLLTRRRR